MLNPRAMLLVADVTVIGALFHHTLVGLFFGLMVVTLASLSGGE